MLLTCPHCGARPENEFRYGGSSHIARPPLDCSDAQWGTYLFFRTNTPGIGAERWCHVFGCGQWFNLLRDATTHEVFATYGMVEPRPALAKDIA